MRKNSRPFSINSRVNPSIVSNWIYKWNRSRKISFTESHGNYSGCYLKRVRPSIAPGWIYAEERYSPNAAERTARYN